MSQDNQRARSITNDISDGEIDLSTLLLAIAKTKNLVLITVLLTFLGIIAFLAISKLAAPSILTYQNAINFVFPGIDEKNPIYPSEIPFAPSDLLAPTILQKVYRNNKLGDYGFKQSDFYSAISVHPYSSAYSAILLRYKTRLNNKRLSFVERKSIEENMKEELDVASGKSVLLRLTMTKRIAIPQKLAEKILHDVASEWADYSINKRGVLKLPNVSLGSLVEEDVLNKYDPLLISEIFEDTSVQQLRELRKFSKQKGSNTIIDNESGLSLRALMIRISEFRNYDLNNLRVRIIANGSNDEKITLATLIQRANYYKATQQRFENREVAIEKSLKLYSGKDIGQKMISQDAGSLGRKVTSMTSPQLTEGFINQLINITKNRNKDPFLQNLIESHLEASDQSSQALQSHERLVSLIKMLESSDVVGGVQNKKASEEINVLLKSSLQRLNKFRVISGRLYQSLSSKRMSYRGQLYVGLVLPAKERYSSTHPFLNKGVYSIVFLTTLVAALFAMFSGLVWQMIRKSS